MHFIKVACPSAKLLALYVGNCDLKECATKLEPMFKDRRVLFVVSTDFCHWGGHFAFKSGSPPYNEYI
jgi:AmmeMemoRadiSam system protein B